MKVTAKQSTVIKLKPQQSSELPPSQKIVVNKGESLEIDEYLPAEKGHLKASLDFYFWPDHWESDNNKGNLNTDPNTIILDVPYLNQRDNKYEPNSTCNVTCVAMVLKYFDKDPSITNGLQLEDYLYERLKNDGKQKTWHAHLSELTNDFGVTNNFTTTA
ncbi:C39 family peptidase, partial [Cyanothece sp. BG0011]|uniref:C39 family peptidase n=1 Tax=Cyanothece sp. BG0011 TaxID=2082950 RepID=UPI0018E58FE4